ncbi:hypothetical protein SAY87_002788 [Trapa incisa]|uniref:DUF7950 domain-containing protein n=1 Tax=Trapa incisa TaxID=236973 RepID=A0AAN7PVT5_9MYRT|nr:hypothetical protein SAY87_002788 [Trapa incisa]
MIDRVMMMRCWPIAPKPAEGYPPADVDRFRNKSFLFSGIRTKRKYVRVRSRNKNRKSNGQLERSEPPTEKAAVTLQLFPDKANYLTESSQSSRAPLQQSASSSSAAAVQSSIHISPSSNPSLTPKPQPWLPNCMSLHLTDPTTTTARRIESWITVEIISTCACPYALQLGRSDEEKAGRLGSSACPGLVFDLSNQVLWINIGYLEMVRRGFGATDDRAESAEMAVAVGLSVRVEVGGLPRWCEAFTCRVRVREERRSRVVPCDVWRMDSGGFAWRLDVKAALSLGNS